MTTSENRNAATLNQMQNATPYPNVLNPIDEPPASKKRTVALDLQQRETAHEASMRSQHLPASSQQQSAHIRYPPEKLRLSIYTDDDADMNFDAAIMASSGLEQVTFPGWNVTSFDEHNLWAGNVL